MLQDTVYDQIMKTRQFEIHLLTSLTHCIIPFNTCSQPHQKMQLALLSVHPFWVDMAVGDEVSVGRVAFVL